MSGENQYLIRKSDNTVVPLQAYGFRVAGLGSMPIEFRTRQGYKQHGVVVDDWKLGARTITFVGDLFGRDRRQFWAKRQALIHALTPEAGAVTFRTVLPNGAQRDIDGWVDASMALVEPEDGRITEATFGLMCPDPTFYDPVESVYDLMAHSVNTFVLPFAFPDDMWFGGLTILSDTCNNAGTWRAYPIITITGPYERIVFHNLTTGIEFTLGVAVPAGDIVTVDMTPGQQRIIRNGANAYGDLESGNLVDWLLAPGQNVLSVSGAGIVAGQTAVRITFHARYLAI